MEEEAETGQEELQIERQRHVFSRRRRLKDEGVSGADTAIRNSAAAAASTHL